MNILMGSTVKVPRNTSSSPPSGREETYTTGITDALKVRWQSTALSIFAPGRPEARTLNPPVTLVVDGNGLLTSSLLQVTY